MCHTSSSPATTNPPDLLTFDTCGSFRWCPLWCLSPSELRRIPPRITPQKSIQHVPRYPLEVCHVTQAAVSVPSDSSLSLSTSSPSVCQAEVEGLPPQMSQAPPTWFIVSREQQVESVTKGSTPPSLPVPTLINHVPVPAEQGGQFFSRDFQLGLEPPTFYVQFVAFTDFKLLARPRVVVYD